MSGHRSWLPSRRLFEADFESLSDVELVALVIGSGITESQALKDATHLLEVIGSAEELKGMSWLELCRGG